MTDELGIVKGLTFKEYDARYGITRRDLSLNGNWEKTHYYVTHPKEDTESFATGRALHAAATDAATLEREFYFTEEYSRATKEGKARWAEDLKAAGDRTIIRGHEVMAMAASVACHPGASKLLSGGDAEVSVFWAMGTDLCKARLDYIRNGVIVEIKTCQSADPRSFVREMIKYQYHVQIAWQRLGLSHYMPVKGCAFVCVEKPPPYCVATYYVPNEDVDKAESLVLRRLDEYRQCQKDGHYPGYPENPQELRIPAWAWGDVDEVTLDY